MASRHSEYVVLDDVHLGVHLDRSSYEVHPHARRAFGSAIVPLHHFGIILLYCLC